MGLRKDEGLEDDVEQRANLIVVLTIRPPRSLSVESSITRLPRMRWMHRSICSDVARPYACLGFARAIAVVFSAMAVY